MEAQVGSTSLPILLTPRIDGLPVKVSDIKTKYSGKFISDGATPMNFYLEYQSRIGTKTVIVWDPSSSTDSTIYFPIPNSVYTIIDTYTLLFYWTVQDLSIPPVILERIYVEEPSLLDVKDLHTQ